MAFLFILLIPNVYNNVRYSKLRTLIIERTGHKGENNNVLLLIQRTLKAHIPMSILFVVGLSRRGCHAYSLNKYTPYCMKYWRHVNF